ncbi:MAG: hypothetical protein AB7N91_21690 [Candidatus Tectimicrobiota bacterium]
MHHSVTQADLTTLGGVTPMRLYLAESHHLETISGLGWWRQAASSDLFQQ